MTRFFMQIEMLVGGFVAFVGCSQFLFHGYQRMDLLIWFAGLIYARTVKIHMAVP